MQTACGIDDDHIAALGLGRLDTVKHNGGGIRTLLLADNSSTAALSPNFQLIGCGRTESIAGNQQNILAFIHQAGGNLADGGGLTHTVNTDDQDYRGGGAEVQLRIAHIQHIHQDLLKSFLGLFRGLQMLLADTLTQGIGCLHGGIHTQIRQD